MSSRPRASVIVRAKDEAESIGRTLALLADQTVAAETIVVDSGSTDGTVAIARDAGARVIEIPAESFTYGYSLNVGCAEASAELLVALSAHAFPRDARWIERMLEPFDDDRVACICGYENDPDGDPLTAARVQDIEYARRHPLWGYSNSSGAFRAELWRERPFSEDMPGTEDKEWAWHWLERGRLVVVDPALAVDHTHAGESLRETYGRACREWAGFAIFLDLPRYGPAGLAREWWTEQGGHASMLRARLSHRRAAKLLGGYRGRRVGAACRTMP